MVLIRATLLAFVGAVAWFWWTAAHQSTGACFTYAHYAPSASVALVLITGAAVGIQTLAASASRDPKRSLWVTVAAPALVTAGALVAAVFAAAVVSCSGG